MYDICVVYNIAVVKRDTTSSKYSYETTLLRIDRCTYEYSSCKHEISIPRGKSFFYSHTFIIVTDDI